MVRRWHKRRYGGTYNGTDGGMVVCMMVRRWHVRGYGGTYNGTDGGTDGMYDGTALAHTSVWWHVRWYGGTDGGIMAHTTVWWHVRWYVVVGRWHGGGTVVVRWCYSGGLMVCCR